MLDLLCRAACLFAAEILYQGIMWRASNFGFKLWTDVSFQQDCKGYVRLCPENRQPYIEKFGLINQDLKTQGEYRLNSLLPADILTHMTGHTIVCDAYSQAPADIQTYPDFILATVVRNKTQLKLAPTVVVCWKAGRLMTFSALLCSALLYMRCLLDSILQD